MHLLVIGSTQGPKGFDPLSERLIRTWLTDSLQSSSAVQKLKGWPEFRFFTVEHVELFWHCFEKLYRGRMIDFLELASTSATQVLLFKSRLLHNNPRFHSGVASGGTDSRVVGLRLPFKNFLSFRAIRGFYRQRCRNHCLHQQGASPTQTKARIVICRIGSNGRTRKHTL